MLFRTDFITYKGVYRSIETDKLNFPTSEGERTILSNHMDIIIPLAIGVIETKEADGQLHHYAVNNGVLYFRDNVASIVADNVIDVKEIDMAEAQADKEKAQQRLAKASREYEKIFYHNLLDVAENMIKAAEDYSE